MYNKNKGDIHKLQRLVSTEQSAVGLCYEFGIGCDINWMVSAEYNHTIRPDPYMFNFMKTLGSRFYQ